MKNTDNVIKIISKGIIDDTPIASVKLLGTRLLDRSLAIAYRLGYKRVVVFADNENEKEVMSILNESKTYPQAKRRIREDMDISVAPLLSHEEFESAIVLRVNEIYDFSRLKRLVRRDKKDLSKVTLYRRFKGFCAIK